MSALKNICLAFLMAVLVFSCPEKPCEDCLPDDIIMADYNTTTYNFNFPDWLPEFDIPADNPMTQEGIALGRRLFYDPMLSSSQTMSCNSCHQLENSFASAEAFNISDSGMEGTRSSMPLINLGFNDNAYHWDGKASSLEEQALMAVEDPLMLNASWVEVVSRLKTDADYPIFFREAFGIERKSEITKTLAAKAIAQFERTLVSYNSRYDKVVWDNDGWFLNEEERGKSLFFKEDSQIEEHPGCSHCHIAKYLTDNSFKNNGLDNPGSLLDFPDLGRGGVNGNLYDNGKFRVPTLRNVEFTAPYMHDGRFETLEEVLDHYSAGGHDVENEDINIRPFSLTEMQKQDMISFLKTLTDTTFLNNPAFKSPF